MANFYVTFVFKIFHNRCFSLPLYAKQCSVSIVESQQTALETLRKCLAHDNVLTNYDSQQEICVFSDNSGYGFGAVLFYASAQGNERLVYLAF